MTDDEWKNVQMNGNWSFLTEKQLLMIESDKEIIENLIIFAGHDWENETETILFTGLDSRDVPSGEKESNKLSIIFY